MTCFTQGGHHVFSMRNVDNHTPTIDKDLPRHVSFCYRSNHNREGFYGWPGNGGSAMMWNPTTKIGFSYLPSTYFVFDFGNVRSS